MGGSRGKGRPFFHVDDILQLNWPAQVILNTSASFFHGVSMETEKQLSRFQFYDKAEILWRMGDLTSVVEYRMVRSSASSHQARGCCHGSRWGVISREQREPWVQAKSMGDYAMWEGGGWKSRMSEDAAEEATQGQLWMTSQAQAKEYGLTILGIREPTEV